MSIFKDDKESEELETQVMTSNLSDHNKILVIRCIENARTSYSCNDIHYKNDPISGIKIKGLS